MEISRHNFERLCLLIKYEDYKVNGFCSTGIMLQKRDVTARNASLSIKNVCNKCGCHRTEGNCNPTPETTDPAEIFAEIS